MPFTKNHLWSSVLLFMMLLFIFYRAQHLINSLAGFSTRTAFAKKSTRAALNPPGVSTPRFTGHIQFPSTYSYLKYSAWFNALIIVHTLGNKPDRCWTRGENESFDKDYTAYNKLVQLNSTYQRKAQPQTLSVMIIIQYFRGKTDILIHKYIMQKMCLIYFGSILIIIKQQITMK